MAAAFTFKIAWKRELFIVRIKSANRRGITIDSIPISAAATIWSVIISIDIHRGARCAIRCRYGTQSTFLITTFFFYKKLKC